MCVSLFPVLGYGCEYTMRVSHESRLRRSVSHLCRLATAAPVGFDTSWYWNTCDNLNSRCCSASSHALRVRLTQLSQIHACLFSRRGFSSFLLPTVWQSHWRKGAAAHETERNERGSMGAVCVGIVPVMAAVTQSVFLRSTVTVSPCKNSVHVYVAHDRKAFEHLKGQYFQHIFKK